jgi:hypothetical protein
LLQIDGDELEAELAAPGDEPTPLPPKPIDVLQRDWSEQITGDCD